jgi:hypothetical protein
MIFRDKAMVDSIRFKYDLHEVDDVNRSLNDNRNMLLAKCLKLNKGISPSISMAIEKVRNVSNNLCSLDVFVMSSPEINAFAILDSSKKANIVLTSSLIKLLDIEELAFVIGHEMGHCLFEHNYSNDLDKNVSEHFYLNKLYKKRMCEISADRIGFLCLDKKEKAYSAIIKSMSGLDDKYVNLNLQMIMDQFNELYKNVGDMDFSMSDSHPIFMTRMRALLLFEMGDLYYDLIDSHQKSPISHERIEEKIYNEINQVGSSCIKKINDELIIKAQFLSCGLILVSKGLLNEKAELLMSEFGNLYSSDLFDEENNKGNATWLNKAYKTISIFDPKDKKTFINGLVMKLAVLNKGDKAQYKILDAICKKIKS